MKNNAIYPTSEHNILFALLMTSAGMMGAYTFLMRGGVFCNAQTANVVLMSIAFGQGKWMKGLYFLIPMSAYLGGALIAQLLQYYLSKIGIFRWSTYLVFIEIITLFIVGFIPLTWSHHIVQIIINFLASMQFTSFKRAEGIPMSTTFCTNHIRQIGMNIANAINEKDPSYLRRSLVHFIMVLFFFGGGVLLTVLCDAMQAKSIWLSVFPLGIVLILLVRSDIKEHKDLKSIENQQ